VPEVQDWIFAAAADAADAPPAEGSSAIASAAAKAPAASTAKFQPAKRCLRVGVDPTVFDQAKAKQWRAGWREAAAGGSGSGGGVPELVAVNGHLVGGLGRVSRGLGSGTGFIGARHPARRGACRDLSPRCFASHSPQPARVTPSKPPLRSLDSQRL